MVKEHPSDRKQDEIKGFDKSKPQRQRFRKISQTLFKISHAINSSPGIDDLYHSIHTALSDIIDTTNFYISLYDKASDSIAFPYFVDTIDECYPTVLEVSKTESLTARVIRTCQPLFVRKEEITQQRDTTPHEIPACTPAEIWLGVPLKIQEKIIGVMAVQNYTDPHRYDQTDMDVLLSVADQVAMAIDSKRHQQALRNSESRLRALSEASFEAIFLSDEGICLDQNPAAEKLFGYTHKEAVGRHGSEWIAPQDREIVKAHMQSGYEKHYEVTALRKDGTTFPCEIHARMIHYQGRPVRVTVLHDITEHRIAQRALQASEESQRELMENLPAGIIVVDPQTRRIEITNAAAEQLFSATKARIIGQKCHTFICRKAENECPICDLNQTVDNSEREIITADGRRRQVIKSVNRIHIGGREKLLEMFCGHHRPQKSGKGPAGK